MCGSSSFPVTIKVYKLKWFKYSIMLSSLLTLGSRYVPSLLRTIGGGVSKLIGGNSVVKTLGSKIKNNPILHGVYNTVKEIGGSVIKGL